VVVVVADRDGEQVCRTSGKEMDLGDQTSEEST